MARLLLASVDATAAAWVASEGVAAADASVARVTAASVFATSGAVAAGLGLTEPRNYSSPSAASSFWRWFVKLLLVLFFLRLGLTELLFDLGSKLVVSRCCFFGWG